jgi:hypothetical protein
MYYQHNVKMLKDSEVLSTQARSQSGYVSSITQDAYVKLGQMKPSGG